MGQLELSVMSLIHNLKCRKMIEPAPEWECLLCVFSCHMGKTHLLCIEDMRSGGLRYTEWTESSPVREWVTIYMALNDIFFLLKQNSCVYTQIFSLHQKNVLSPPLCLRRRVKGKLFQGCHRHRITVLSRSLSFPPSLPPAPVAVLVVLLKAGLDLPLKPEILQNLAQLVWTDTVARQTTNMCTVGNDGSTILMSLPKKKLLFVHSWNFKPSVLAHLIQALKCNNFYKPWRSSFLGWALVPK